jgi:hypothetical protein
MAREGPVHYVPNDGRRFPICGSWRSNWNHTGDAQRATCPSCRARLAARAPASAEAPLPQATMPDTVAVVHMDSGLVAVLTNDTLTSDLPTDISDDATEASLDEAGHLHYLGGDGSPHVCEATTRMLGDRAPSDVCLLSSSVAQRERTGWSLLEVCMLEPRP